MATLLEHTLSLRDRVSGTLDRIGASARKQQTALTGLQRQVTASEQAMTRCGVRLAGALRAAGAYLGGAEQAWHTRLGTELKLTAAMRQHLGASDEEIASLHRLAAAQQAIGVVSERVQLAGAGQLAQYLRRRESLEALLPVMNDLMVQERGLHASDEDAAAAGRLLGEALHGQSDALARAGLRASDAELRLLRCGGEQERVAVLAGLVRHQIGQMNRALGATPEGRLQQHANTMLTLQERIGRLATLVRAALLPAVEVVDGALAEAVGWLERHRDTVVAVAGVVAQAAQWAFSVVGSAVGGVFALLGGWIDRLRAGSVPVVVLTWALGSLAAAMGLLTLAAKALVAWTSVVAAVQGGWVSVQSALNLSLLACPLTWIVAGVVALVSIVAYLCYRIEGWGSLWEGVVGFMKYTFAAYVESVKLYFTTLVNGIMIGLDKIKLGWYRFKEACGIGDSARNRSAIAQINADVEARQQAIAQGAQRIAENAGKARESLAGIRMSWNDKSLADVATRLKNRLGIPAAVPEGTAAGFATGSAAGFATGSATGDFTPATATDGGFSAPLTTGSGAASASAIASAGGAARSVTINLRSLVERIVFEGGYGDDREAMLSDVENALIRLLQAANTAK